MVACFDGQPVTAAEVGEHVRPIAPVDGRTSTASAQAAALKAALRVRMFAAEAARRKLAGGGGRDARSRAVLHQALVRDEASRNAATADQIPLDEARRHYEARPGEFNKISKVWVRAIVSESAAAADAAYREVTGRDEAAFAAVAQRISADASAASGGDLGEAHADGIDPAVRRAANDLRAAGDLRGPVPLGNDRWVILRATRIEMVVRPFEEVARDVQHALARRRETAALDALHGRLEAGHRVVVFDDELARLPEPAPPSER